MVEETDEEKRRLTAAEYALGLLPADEARAFEAEMDVSAAAREDYAFWCNHIVGLTDDIAPVEPPAAVLTRVQAALFTPEASRKMRRPGLFERLGLLPAMGVGLAAALAVLVVVNQVVDTPQLGVGAMATLVSDDGSLAVQVAYTEFSDTIRIDRSAGTPPEGQAFQLWLIKDDLPPISLGILPDDPQSTLQIAEAIQPLLRGARCAITVEPEGGSPTGQPTGDFLAEARIVWEA